MIQIITGHGFNLYHQGLKAHSIEYNDECRFCGEESEDTQHIVNGCEGLRRLREEYLPGDHMPITLHNNPEGILSLSRFLMDPHMDELFRPPGTE